MPLKKSIDLTILKPNSTYEEVKKICQIVLDEGYRSACIPPIFVERIYNEFKCDRFDVLNDKLKICSVLAFPLGNVSLINKIEEYSRLAMFCNEIDMVAPIHLIKSGEWKKIKHDMELLNSRAKFWKIPIKLILETYYLEEEEIKKMCYICRGLDMFMAMKTSTGFAKKGATKENIKIIRKYWDRDIKASGGIKTKKQALALMKAGATIIGTSSIF